MTVEELMTALAQFDPNTPVAMCVNSEASLFVRKAYRYGGEIVLTNEYDDEEATDTTRKEHDNGSPTDRNQDLLLAGVVGD